MNARLAASKAIHAVCENGQSLDQALLECAPSNQAQDAALFQALSYGGVRWYLAYQGIIKGKLKKPFKPKDRMLYAVLVVAMYQLDHTEQASHAVVNEAVNCVKALKREWASGLVNAILRAYMREGEHDRASFAWYRSSFSKWMLEEIEQAWPKQLDQILQASQQQPPMTLRINLQKTTPEDYLELLAKQGFEAKKCLDSIAGITLEKPMSVQKLPKFNEAWLSVQDESAQLAVELMDLSTGHKVLDACAAPGGKSLHICEAQADLDELVALDFATRLPRLRENFARAGMDKNPNIKIIEGDLNESNHGLDEAYFDRILLDVPCTGTGVIRRHPDIKFRRQAENGIQFAAQQRGLLSSAWRLLKPGGKLLYTTCSIMPIENQDNIAKFLQQTANAKALVLPEKLGIKTKHGRQRLCGTHSGDGFFYALLEKQS